MENDKNFESQEELIISDLFDAVFHKTVNE